MEKIIAIEYSKKNPELFNYWTEERIKGAFNFGNGTIKDLKRYAKNNKQFCTIVFL